MGVAVNLRWEQGSLVLALTLGDGTRGDDIVQQVRTIRNVPLVLSSTPKSLRFAVRSLWMTCPFLV